MSWIASSFDFVNRHKSKIAIAGGLVYGLFSLNRSPERFERSQKDSHEIKFLTESSRKIYEEDCRKEADFLKVFESCNSKTGTLSWEISNHLNLLLDTSSIIDDFKFKGVEGSSKIALWEELRVRIMTRCMTEVVCLSFFICLFRVQEPAIAGYSFAYDKSSRLVLTTS